MNLRDSEIFNPESPLYQPFVLAHPKPLYCGAECTTTARDPDVLDMDAVRKAIDMVMSLPKRRYFSLHVNPDARKFLDWLKDSPLSEIPVSKVWIIPYDRAMLFEFDMPHYYPGAKLIGWTSFEWKEFITQHKGEDV